VGRNLVRASVAMVSLDLDRRGAEKSNLVYLERGGPFPSKCRVD
jgi:hypothetical protein